jgi:peptidoglycan/xylan/chitin deacetylase (PgdA/CDA1 family)
MNICLDRQLTLSIFRWLPSGSAYQRVPILMYHSVSDEQESVAPYYRLATSPQRFAEQMQWLDDGGYVGLSLEEALPFMDGGRAGSRLPVAITFDDGYRNFYTTAWPILRGRGFTATMYLPTGYIGSERKSFLGRPCLNWAEVRELQDQGVHFGSHTVSHPVLHNLSMDLVERELRFSKKAIENELGQKVTGFAYPYAFPQEDTSFSRRLADRLRECGYETCVTTIIGRADAAGESLRLKRLPVNSCDDHDLFMAKLRGCYDWVGSAQRAVRHLKRIYK